MCTIKLANLPREQKKKKNYAVHSSRGRELNIISQKKSATEKKSL